MSIHNGWYIPIVEYYSAVERKEILTQATTGMNLRDSLLSEISQTQKDKYCMIPLIQGAGGVREPGQGGGGMRVSPLTMAHRDVPDHMAHDTQSHICP